MPIRGGYAKEIFVVTSGEKMALYAAGNIALAVDQFKNRGYARFGGLILNRRNIREEDALVAKFADSIDSSVVGTIDRSPLVQEAEEAGQTVVERFPESGQAAQYHALSKQFIERYQEGEEQNG